MDQEMFAKSASPRRQKSKRKLDSYTTTNGPDGEAEPPTVPKSERSVPAARFFFGIDWSRKVKKIALLTQPSASRHSARVRWRQVNMGVSRNVKQLAFVSLSSWTRSRKSEGLSVSNATTNS